MTEPSPTRHSGHQRLQGLLVDNEASFLADLRDLLEERFGKAGSPVDLRPCTSTAEAQALLARGGQFDIVLTDTFFPPLGRPDAPQTEHIRSGMDVVKAAGEAGVPIIIAFTQEQGHRVPELRAAAKSYGATSFFQRDDLIAAYEDSVIPEIAAMLLGRVAGRIADKEDEMQTQSAVSVAKDPRSVAVVHGQNPEAEEAIFAFLRALDLSPVEWEEAIEWSESAAPAIPSVLKELFARSQAVVVLLTPDEHVYLHETLAESGEQRGLQARPNVYIEAGMALAHQPTRTIVVRLGQVRSASDIEALHAIVLDDTPARRQALARRLKNAGCPVKETKAMFSAGKFEDAVAAMKKRAP